MDLLDGAKDHRRGALNRPTHQVGWVVAVMDLGESLLDRHDLAVRAGGHVAVGQHAGRRVWRSLELQAQDVGKSAFARAVEVRVGDARVGRPAGSIYSPRAPRSRSASPPGGKPVAGAGHHPWDDVVTIVASWTTCATTGG